MPCFQRSGVIIRHEPLLQMSRQITIKQTIMKLPSKLNANILVDWRKSAVRPKPAPFGSFYWTTELIFHGNFRFGVGFSQWKHLKSVLDWVKIIRPCVNERTWSKRLIHMPHIITILSNPWLCILISPTMEACINFSLVFLCVRLPL